MKERFYFSSLTPLEAAVVEGVDAAWSYYDQRLGNASAMQIYSSLLDRGDVPRMQPNELRTTIRRGLLFGLLDWEMTPDGPHPPYYCLQRAGESPVDLWVETPQVNWGIFEACRRGISLVALAPRLIPHPHLLYRAMLRFSRHIEHGPCKVYYLPSMHRTVQQLEYVHRMLTRMLTVRVARRLFNDAFGAELWIAENVFRPTDMPKDQAKAAVTAAMVRAGELVSANLIVRDLREFATAKRASPYRFSPTAMCGLLDHAAPVR